MQTHVQWYTASDGQTPNVCSPRISMITHRLGTISTMPVFPNLFLSASDRRHQCPLADGSRLISPVGGQPCAQPPYFQVDISLRRIRHHHVSRPRWRQPELPRAGSSLCRPAVPNPRKIRGLNALDEDFRDTIPIHAKRPTVAYGPRCTSTSLFFSHAATTTTNRPSFLSNVNPREP